MNSEIIEGVIEEWFRKVSKEFPSEIAGEVISAIRKTFLDLLMEKKGVYEVVSEIDEDLLRKVIKSGSKPADFTRRSEILIKMLSSRVDETTLSRLIPILASFQIKFLERVIRIYEEILEGEIAERKRVERALRVLGRVNQAILEAEDERSLLEDVCRIVVDEGYVYAWIGYAEKDKRVRPVAKAGKDGYADRIKVTWDESETGMGPTGTAIRSRKAVVVRDIESESSFSPWRELAIERGYMSSIALPLKYKDVIGSLNIYASERNAFSEEEVKLLKELAGILSQAIAYLREKREKERIEELYKTLIENTGTGMILVSKDGKVIFVNEKIVKEIGSREKLIGKHFTELLPEDEREKVLATFKLRQIDPESTPKSYEVRFIDAKGEIRYAIVTVTLFDEQFLVSLIDITELKKMRGELRESEKKYKSIFDVSPLPIILSGIDMVIFDCNDAALKLLNQSREEVIGKKWPELGIDKKDLPWVMESFYRRLKDGKQKTTEPFEMKIKVRDDIKEKWLRVFPTPIEVEGKRALLNIIEDITDIKLSEKNLKDALERLKILRSIDLGIIKGKSIEKVAGEVAEALKQKTGCELVCISASGKEPVGESICSLLKDRSMLEELRKRRGEKGVVKVESIVKLNDLLQIEIELLKAGVKNYTLIPLTARDEEVGLLLIASRKKLSEENIYFVRQLAGQLAIALHEALLYEEKREALEQIEKNLEQFAILIDHIRNPLGVILGVAELKIDDESVRSIIKDSVERIEEVVERLDKGWLESEEIRRFLRRFQ